MTWALYSAYSLLFGWAATEAKMLQMDGNFDRFWNSKGIEAVLIKALPDLENYIRNNGCAAHMHLPEMFRSRILAELKRSLSGEKQDEEGVARAAAIIEQVREYRRNAEDARAKELKSNN